MQLPQLVMRWYVFVGGKIEETGLGDIRVVGIRCELWFGRSIGRNGWVR